MASRGTARGYVAFDFRDPSRRGAVWVALWLSDCPERARGRVVDAHGRPLAGVGVWERYNFVAHAIGVMSAYFRLSSTDRSGRFDVCGGGQLAVGGGRFARSVLPGGEAAPDVVMLEKGTLRGLVRASDGRRLVGALVKDAGVPVTATDSQGTWVADAEPGCHEVWAEYRGASHEPVRVCVFSGQTVDVPPLVVRRCVGLVLGVVNVSGVGGRGLRVDAAERSVVTGPAGDFALDCPAGRLEVAGYLQEPSEESLDPEQNQFVAIRAWPRPVVHGQVNSGGRPVAGVRVTIKCPDPREELVVERSEAYTDLAGRYELLAAPGRCAVAAGGPWWEGSEERVIQVGLEGRERVDLLVSPARHK